MALYGLGCYDAVSADNSYSCVAFDLPDLASELTARCFVSPFCTVVLVLSTGRGGYADD